MPATATKTPTLRGAINDSNLNMLAPALRAMRLGTTQAKIKVTFASLTSAAAVDITTAASLAAATVAGIVLSNENLPPIGKVVTLRVTAGAAAAGARNVTDAGGTASTTFALLSDDGKTLTFETTVTGFVLTYYPAPAVGLDSQFLKAEP